MDNSNYFNKRYSGFERNSELSEKKILESGKDPHILRKVGLALIILNVIFLFSVIIFSYGYQKKITDQSSFYVFQIEGDVIAEASGATSANVSKTGSFQEFSSNVLKKSYKYDFDQILMNDGKDSVIVEKKGLNSLDFQGKIYILNATENASDFVKNRQNELKKEIPQGTEIKLEKEGVVNDVNYGIYALSYENYFDKTAVAEKRIFVARKGSSGLTVFSCKVANNSLEKTLETKLIDEIANVLDSENTAKVSAKSQIELTKAGLSLEYEISKFKLGRNSTEYFELISMAETGSSLFVETRDAKEFQTEANLEKYLQEIRDGDKANAKNGEIKNLITKKETIVGGKTFKQYQYSYFENSQNDASGKEVQRTIYGAYTTSKEKMIVLIVTEKGSNLSKDSDIQKLFNLIKFSEKEVNQKIQSNGNSNFNTADQQKNVLGTSSIKIDKAETIILPSVVRIYSHPCIQISLSDDPGLKLDVVFKNMLGKKYSVCTTAFGTGFFVGSDGNFITNSELISPSSIKLIFDKYLERKYINDSFAIEQPDFISEFLAGIKASLTSKGVPIEKIQEDAVLKEALKFYSAKNYLEFAVSSETYVASETSMYLDPATGVLLNKGEQIKADIVKNIQFTDDSGSAKNGLTVLKITNNEGKKYAGIDIEKNSKTSDETSTVAVFFSEIGSKGNVYDTENLPRIHPAKLSDIKTKIFANVSVIPVFNLDNNLIGLMVGNQYVDSKKLTDLAGEFLVKDKNYDIVAQMKNFVLSFSFQHYLDAKVIIEQILVENSSLGKFFNPYIVICNEEIKQGFDQSPSDFFVISGVDKFFDFFGLKMLKFAIYAVIIGFIGVVTGLILLLVDKKKSNFSSTQSEKKVMPSQVENNPEKVVNNVEEKSLEDPAKIGNITASQLYKGDDIFLGSRKKIDS